MSFIVRITYYFINGVRFLKQCSLFWFFKFSYLVDLSVCLCINRAKPWLKLSFKFNWWSIGTFQRVLAGFHNLWVYLSSREFQLESWAGEVIFFSFQRKFYIVFSNFLFDKFLNNIYLSYVPKFVFKRIWLKILYFHLKESCTLLQILIFLNRRLFCPIGVIKDRVIRMYPKYFKRKLWPYFCSVFIMVHSIRLGFLKSLSLS